MCSATVMNSIVGKALQVSIYSDTTEHAQNLAFALKNMPEIFKPNGLSLPFHCNIFNSEPFLFF